MNPKTIEELYDESVAEQEEILGRPLTEQEKDETWEQIKKEAR